MTVYVIAVMAVIMTVSAWTAAYYYYKAVKILKKQNKELSETLAEIYVKLMSISDKNRKDKK